MTVPFARRMARVRPSAIRELLRLGADPDVVSFGGGYPDPALLPVDQLREVYARLLVPERDSAALAVAFRTLLANPASWATMGRAAREKVEREYDIEKLNDRLVAHYERLVRGDP